ncbi:F-box only protein 27 isoform X2 [Mastomys coucha]|uniref:F-box only protein 27 isoform X2 n=1 Tax=Mastomys coucha TaxID=35658 RepID=UPI001261C667|nr:F-box only protein 27 isoform X2 [Mastomys coucha]
MCYLGKDGNFPAKRDAETMGAWTSRTRVPMPEPDPQEALDLCRLPPELLLLVLSHVPPRALLRHCRRVCRAWRALVDGQALWLLLLSRDHSAADRALLTLARRCLPPAREDTPCPLGRFCALRPLGRNLLSNPCGQEGLRKWMVRHGGDGWVVEKNRKPVPGAPSQTCFVTSFSWCRKKQVVDLVEKGLWPELLDSGGVEIAVSDWWGARHDSGCKYRLFVTLLDAHQNVIDKFSAVPDPIEQWNNDIYLQGIPAGDNSPAFDTHVLGLQAHTNTTQFCAVLGMSPGFRACQVNILLFEQQPSIPSCHVLFLPQGLSLSLHFSPLLRAELRIYG